MELTPELIKLFIYLLLSSFGLMMALSSLSKKESKFNIFMSIYMFTLTSTLAVIFIKDFLFY